MDGIFESPLVPDHNPEGYERCVKWRHDDYMHSRALLDGDLGDRFEFINPGMPLWGSDADNIFENLFLNKTYGLFICTFLSLFELRIMMCVSKKLRSTYYKIWREHFIFTLPKNRPRFASFLHENHIKHAIWNTKFYVESISPIEDFRPFNLQTQKFECQCMFSDRLRFCINLKSIKIPTTYKNHCIPDELIAMRNCTVYIYLLHDKLMKAFKCDKYIFYGNCIKDRWENTSTSLPFLTYT